MLNASDEMRDFGNTPVLTALTRGNVAPKSIADILATSDKNAAWQPNTSGITPVKAATMNANAEVMTLLIEYGAYITDQDIEFCERAYPDKTDVLAVLRSAQAKQALHETINQQESITLLPPGL